MKILARALALLSFLSFAVTAAEPGTGASFKGPVGLQLYSLRGIATQNPPKALAQTKDFGLTLVETAGTYNLPPEKFKALLAEHGLKPISGHFPYDRWKAEPEKVLAEAKAIGLQYAGCGWITHKAPFSETAARDAIATFNKAGELGAKLGIKVFYHAHGFEFHKHVAVKLWDATAGTVQHDLSKEFKDMQIAAAAYSADGKTLALGRGGEADGNNGKVFLVNPATGKKEREFTPGHQYGITDLCFHPDGKHLASCGRDTVVRLWNLADGRLVKELGKPRGGQFKDWIHAISISADGTRLAAADMAGFVHVWQLGA